MIILAVGVYAGKGLSLCWGCELLLPFYKTVVVSWKITHTLPTLPSYKASKPLLILLGNVRMPLKLPKNKVEALYFKLPQISKNQDVHQ